MKHELLMANDEHTVQAARSGKSLNIISQPQETLRPSPSIGSGWKSAVAMGDATVVESLLADFLALAD